MISEIISSFDLASDKLCPDVLLQCRKASSKWLALNIGLSCFFLNSFISLMERLQLQ